jgi:DNA-binding LacI/PurR family transcriptional regulator
MCTSYEAPVVHKFIQTGEKEAKSRGWNINIIRIHDNETNLVNKIIKSGNKCIFLWDNLDSSVISIMQAYNEQIVLIGADMSALGIRSVFINLSLTASLLIDTLKKNGHNKVALILHNAGRMLLRTKPSVNQTI